jgi:hypothetical protein
MNIRRITVDTAQVLFSVVEWYLLYVLLLRITKGSLLATVIIISLLGIIVIFSLLILIFSKDLFQEDESLIRDTQLSYFEATMQEVLTNLGYDLKFKILPPTLNVSAFNYGEYIVFNKEALSYHLDDNGSLNMEYFYALLSHELGHFESGITKSKLYATRPSSLIIGYLRLLLDKMEMKNKKGFLYYFLVILFYMFNLINPIFLFLRQDEHYANKSDILGTNIYLLKYYMLITGRKPLHDIFHPSAAKMIKKMLPSFEQYENSDIYYEGDTLAYAPTESNLKRLEELVLEHDDRALYETGINMILGKFEILKDTQVGLSRILKAYELGNKKALRYLIYHNIDLIKSKDLVVDYTNEEQIEQLNINNLREIIYNDVFNNYDLNNEDNLNILIDAYRIGNKMGVSLYIEWLLEKYDLPMKAQEAYKDILDSYPALDFSSYEWYPALNFINLIKNLDEKYEPKKEYIKDYLIQDLKNERQLIWNYTRYLIQYKDRFDIIFLKVIEMIWVDNNGVFDEIKNNKTREYFKKIEQENTKKDLPITS